MLRQVTAHPRKLPTQQSGMTLIELLVVMVILAMVSALLIQGLGGALITYERVQRQQQQSLQPTLAYRWLAGTLGGAQAELDEPRQFHGIEQQLSGYTHRPLVGQSGQVSAFSWQLRKGEQNELQLWYIQGESNQKISWLVLSWPAGSTGLFRYYDFKGSLTSRWPATLNDPLLPDGPIPSAILLEITPTEGRLEPWFISLPGRTFPRPDYRDF